jgi:hypothetical protein
VNAIKNVNAASRLIKFWDYFGAIQMISCRERLPWTKSVYMNVTRRENNNEWRGGIAAHPVPPQKILSAKTRL